MCHHDRSNDQLPLGSVREHGAAHEQHHRRWSRRHFLKTLGQAGSVSLLLGHLPLTALGASPLSYALHNSNEDRILVLIRLKGGNDGLNTIIPVFDYGTYQSGRPTLAIPSQDIIMLDDAFGIPNTMTAAERMWREGSMKVVHSVGYPDENLSHFRSSDIWASASDSQEVLQSGWLGRWLDELYPDYLTNPPDTPPAIQIGGAGNLIFNNEEMLNLSVIVNDPEQLAEIAQNGSLYDATDVPGCYYGDQLSFLRTVANSTFQYAEVIHQAYEKSANQGDYPGTLGRQLALVARLIKGGLSTRLYMVTLDGFDTHARQSVIHPQLMRELSEAVAVFFEDLRNGGVANRTLAVTISEFGRRPIQNASGGTDHGAAAPLLLFGPALEGNGFAGEAPDLRDLDASGNLKFSTDFRQIYATLLEAWLCIDASIVDEVLEGAFDRLPALGLSCALTSIESHPPQPRLKHWFTLQEGLIRIHYVLQEGQRVRLRVFNTMGQPVTTLTDSYQGPGAHQATFHPGVRLPSAGMYIYTIETNGRRYSGKILYSR